MRIEDARKPETRARRIEKAIEMLRAISRQWERRSGMQALVLAGALLNVAWPASADAPLAPRSPVTKCSPSRQFCATADPRLDAVLVYPTYDRQRERWRLAGWERAFDLADDGDHLVVCYSGLNLLPLDYRADAGYERSGVRHDECLSIVFGIDFAAGEHRTHKTWRGAAVSTLPVFGVPVGSINSTCVSCSEKGWCSIPRGTTNNSPGSRITVRSRRRI